MERERARVRGNGREEEIEGERDMEREREKRKRERHTHTHTQEDNCPSELHTVTWPVVFCKLLLNDASYDTKIGCIHFLWTRAKIVNFHCQYLDLMTASTISWSATSRTWSRPTTGSTPASRTSGRRICFWIFVHWYIWCREYTLLSSTQHPNSWRLNLVYWIYAFMLGKC